MKPFRALEMLAMSYLIIGSGASSLAQKPSDDTVRVSVAMHTRYDDSDASLREVKQFIDFMPPETDTVRRDEGESVNTFIIRRYRFGPSELPRTYALLERYILRANDIPSATSALEQDTLLAPPLPRRAVPRPSKINPYNRLPKIITFETASMANREVVEQERPTEDDFREGSRTAVINVELSRAYVLARKDLPLFESPALQISSDRVEVEMNPSACPAAPLANDFPDAQTLAAVSSALLRPLTRRTYLFVLDSGWPDEPTYRTAVTHVEGILASLRATYHLAPYVRRQPATFRAIDPSTTSTHALKVGRALADFRALDTAERVRVIFMPLGLDQGDEDLLRNLLETYYAFAWKTSLDATTPSGAKLSEPVFQDEATVSAEATLERMRKFAPQGAFHTDPVLIDALYMMADATAERDKTSYVLNLSWTVGSNLLKLKPPPKPRGLTVVAVGNDGKDFVAKQVDLAQRGVGDDRFLAVMNISREGALQCKSSLFDASRSSMVRVLGFNGNLSPLPPEQGTSGTSFAAPRVAWMIALRESLSAEPSMDYWATDLITSLKNHRQLNESAWKNIWFEPVRYLQP